MSGDFVERLVAGQLRSRMTELEVELAAERATNRRLRAAGDALAKRLWRGGGDLADMIAAVAAWEEASRG